MNMESPPDDLMPRFAHNEDIETATDDICEEDSFVRLIDPETGRLSAGLSAQCRCPLCDQASDGTVFAERQGFTYARCPNCTMVYMSPRLIDEIHDHRMRNDPNARNSFHAQLAQAENPEDRSLKALIMRLKAAVPRGKLIDIGCGLGKFLLLGRTAGYVVSGIELHAFAAAQARSNGLTVLEKDLQDLDLAPGSIDLVTSFDLIGKLQTPLAFLREVHRVLKPKGRLLLTCPNMESLAAQLLGVENVDALEAPTQINWFTRQTLTAMLRQANFRVLDISSNGMSDFQTLRMQLERTQQSLPPFIQKILWQTAPETEELRKDLLALIKRHALGGSLIAECAPEK